MPKRKYYYTKKYRDLENELHISSSLSSSTDDDEVYTNNAMLNNGNQEKQSFENIWIVENEVTSASGSRPQNHIIYNTPIGRERFLNSEILSSSSSNEICCYETDEEQYMNTSEELNTDISFKEKIRNWSIKHISSLNNKMLSDLLCILKTEHNEFPQTATTFLRTKESKNIVKSMLSANGSFGTYIYFGLEKVLKLMINSEIYMEDIIEILVNIDGVQIYNNSKQQFWPILIMLHNKKYIVKPQVVAIYHGTSKPKSPTEYLNEFITELLNLMTNKITIEDKSYNIKVLGFVCDTPARAFIKCVKSHVAFYACERCIVKGKTVGKNKRIYSRVTCEERNKQSFEARVQSEHYLNNKNSHL